MPTATDPKFSLGQTVSTSNAQKTLNQEDVLNAMARHSRGDWGDLCDEDRQANEQALEHEERLISVYHDRDGCVSRKLIRLCFQAHAAFLS